MKVIRGFDSPPTLRNAVATVGSYDGVHCGHRILLDEVVRRAKECNGESVVLTFEPHPRITLGNDEGLQLLSTFEEKCALLEQVGVDYVVVIPFDEAFSRLSHEEFIYDYLVGRLKIKQLVIGYNHHFGHNKAGNYSFLVEHTPLQVLSEGDIALTRQMLGHPYIIIGIADEEGRVSTDKYKLLPKEGSYPCIVNGKITTCEVEDGVVKQREYFTQKIEILL